MNPILLFVLAPAAGASTASEEAIVVTAALEPQVQADAPVSSTIIEGEDIARLNVPLAADILRLGPGVSIATSGPAGSQAQIRIRGAEANHSLLFVDGIRFNDPAAGNEARFELLSSDSLSRIEVVRGPQSALWGPEAIGGVIAVETADARRAAGVSGLAEYGSLDSFRGAGQIAHRSGSLALSGSAGWLESDGIDSFGSGGERDGFRNRSASAKAIYSPSEQSEFGIVGHLVSAESGFDGFDPATFRRADTLDSSKSRIAAGRLWTRLGFGSARQWSVSGGTSLLDSSNRNLLADDLLNRTSGRRWTANGQVSHNLAAGGTRHSIAIAAEHQNEKFKARDRQYFGATDQDRSRTSTGLAAELRSEWSSLVVTDLAVRHDRFSHFADATTFRASLLLRPTAQWTLHAAYGEGIAQPSFYDLFGFFPGSFVGNPDLRPEASQSWEAGIRWADRHRRVAITGFTGRLDDEIVDIFDFTTSLFSTANASGRSHRRGVEAEVQQRFGDRGLVALSYTYLDASQRQVEGTVAVREVRRPRHSASMLVSWVLGPAEIGASLAYVGERQDTDFESLPSRLVSLDDYLLASLNIGWRLSNAATAFVRAQNLFDAEYEDAFGYETSGRTVHAGIRLRLGT